MEKTINIDGKDIVLKTNGATPIAYQNKFRRDFIGDMMSLGKIAQSMQQKDKEQQDDELNYLEVMSQFNTRLFYDLLWFFAKEADKSIKPQEKWLAEFDNVPILDYIGDIIDLAMGALQQKKR